MARPMSERVRDPIWWAEQGAHFGLGAVAAIPAIWAPMPVLAAASAAFWLAAVREFDQRPVASWGDTVADVAFCVWGGVAVGAAFRAFA